MTTERSDALVFFGATGDLAYKKIFPAFQAMIRRGHLDLPIIGVAFSHWNLDQLKERARDSIEKHGQLDPAAFEKLCSQLSYIDGEYEQPETFAKLKEILGNAKRPLFYLAIPPSLFATVAAGLANSGCTNQARVILEKPFGRDLASAQDLNRTLHQFFPEEAIFRIDHYLGKEPVQNLVYFRFANPFIESGWSNKYLESVQITMAEAFGVMGRGKIYEELGAIRDVVQNHLLHVIACLTMEWPADSHSESLREARGELLRCVRALDSSQIVRGQFQGYRNEPGVAADSQVETFAAVQFHIDNERWAGVPFTIRAGKCLPVTTTEILVRVKPSSHPLLEESGPPMANYYRFRLSPEEAIALGTKIKKPGERMEGEQIELVAHYQEPNEMDPYERLLGDAANGDSALFARQDSVEDAWRVVDPILGDSSPLYEYEPNTWGPAQADQTVAPKGGWHNPEPKEKN
ncbi:MAG: zwf [Planctomycetaceae bacterium]|nr:zwf [Planctomycetaceae bacterium]